MKCRWVTLLLIWLLQSACATVTGSEITSEEEKEARTLLHADAEVFQRAQQKRINDLAARLMRAGGSETPLKFIHIDRLEQTGGKIQPDLVNAWTDVASVGVPRGMMRFVRSADELAIVRAHEWLMPTVAIWFFSEPNKR